MMFAQLFFFFMLLQGVLLHAFTASSFYNHSKVKFFDVWMKYNEKDDVTNFFKELNVMNPFV